MSRRKLGSRPQHLSAMHGKLDSRQLHSHLNEKTQYMHGEPNMDKKKKKKKIYNMHFENVENVKI